MRESPVSGRNLTENIFPWCSVFNCVFSLPVNPFQSITLYTNIYILTKQRQSLLILCTMNIKEKQQIWKYLRRLPKYILTKQGKSLLILCTMNIKEKQQIWKYSQIALSFLKRITLYLKEQDVQIKVTIHRRLKARLCWLYYFQILY